MPSASGACRPPGSRVSRCRSTAPRRAIASVAATRKTVLARLAEARDVQRRERLATRLDVSMVVDESVAHELPAFRARLAPLCDRVQFIPRMRRAPRTAACREPSRGIMVVLSDGTVTTCCADVNGELALGHLATGPDPRESLPAADGPAAAGPGIAGAARRTGPARGNGVLPAAREAAGELSPHALYAGDRWRALRRAHRRGPLPAPCSTCGECDVPGVSRRFL